MLRSQLSQGLGAHELSLAVSVGCACAFFPVLGLATPLCVLAAWGLRLNQAVIQAVNLGTAPVYPVLVFLFFRVGSRCIGVGEHLSRLESVLRYGACVLLGWACVMAVLTPVVYLLGRAAMAARPAAARRPASNAP